MRLSAFDLDHTLLKVNGSFHFGKYLYNKKKLTVGSMLYLVGCYAGAMTGCLNIQQLHQLNFDALFKGRQKSDFQKLVHAFLDEQLANLVHLPMIKTFEKAKADGHRTAILSSSPDFLVQSIGQRLGFDYIGATEYLTDASGAFYCLGPIMNGTEKAVVLNVLAEKYGVKQEDIYAYSDSHLDLPFMEAAGHPIAVSPNRKLHNISQQRGWKIIS
jgi:HAD superfamily hydrolase (TIGR01490 family)